MDSKLKPIVVGSRCSKLALKQVQEVLWGIRYHYPEISFITKCTPCRGDRDLKTSLRDMDATDFFTYELDQWLLKGYCRIAIHSAKDLPDPLPKGLKIVATTQNQNNEDVLVLNSKPHTFTKYPKVGVSSKRREEGVSKLFPHATFHDLRGTIEKRIEKVTTGELDAIAIAKVALMRLNLLHLNMLHLPAETPPMQGALALLARENDFEMESIFSSIDTRVHNKSLFLGLDPSHFLTSGTVTHLPLIEVIARPKEELFQSLFNFHKVSHIILTSQTTLRILLDLLDDLKMPHSILAEKKMITVGQRTAESLMKRGIAVDYVAKKESQEGIVDLLNRLKGVQKGCFFYPRSSKARPLLEHYFQANKIAYQAPIFYDTRDKLHEDYPDIEEFDEVVFTSPSTVDSFFNHYDLPENKLNLIFKGDVTRNYFNKTRLVNK